jgi:hypothetical protein
LKICFFGTIPPAILISFFGTLPAPMFIMNSLVYSKLMIGIWVVLNFHRITANFIWIGDSPSKLNG